MGIEVLIPLTIFIGGFALIFGIVYLKTRENLAMLEKGYNPKAHQHRPAPYKSLKLGLLLFGAGLGLLTAYIIDINTLRKSSEGHEPLYFALIGMGGGLGLIVSYAIEKKELLTRRNTDTAAPL